MLKKIILAKVRKRENVKKWQLSLLSLEQPISLLHLSGFQTLKSVEL